MDLSDIPVKVTIKIITPQKTRYRLRAGVDVKSQTPVWVIQRRAKKGKNFYWLICTAQDKPLVYRDREQAKRHLAWLKDPEGTRAEWDTPEQTPTA